MFDILNLLESISLRFFLFFKIFKASLLNPLEITISKKFLLISMASFFSIDELNATIPPNALIGSQFKAFLKETICFFSEEIPQGLACLTITTPLLFLKVFKIDNAE